MVGPIRGRKIEINLRPMGGREETSEGLAPRRKGETEKIREEESYEKLF